MRSPTRITVPTTAADGTKFYYFSNAQSGCTKGKNLTLTVSPGGVARDLQGMCADIACRKDSSLDHSCCTEFNNPHHQEEASCAAGYRYYQRSTNSDGQSCSGTEWSKGTCCVRDGDPVPQGATEPSDALPTAAPNGACGKHQHANGFLLLLASAGALSISRQM